MGKAYLAGGDKEKTIEVFADLVENEKLYEKEDNHFNDLGIELRRQEMYEETIEKFRRPLDTDPHMMKRPIDRSGIPVGEVGMGTYRTLCLWRRGPGGRRRPLGSGPGAPPRRPPRCRSRWRARGRGPGAALPLGPVAEVDAVDRREEHE